MDETRLTVCPATQGSLASSLAPRARSASPPSLSLLPCPDAWISPLLTPVHGSRPFLRCLIDDDDDLYRHTFNMRGRNHRCSAFQYSLALCAALIACQIHGTSDTLVPSSLHATPRCSAIGGGARGPTSRQDVCGGLGSVLTPLAISRNQSN